MHRAPMALEFEGCKATCMFPVLCSQSLCSPNPNPDPNSGPNHNPMGFGEHGVGEHRVYHKSKERTFEKLLNFMIGA